MSTLLVNVPAQSVWVRKEYLRDGQDGHGEFVKGIWVTAKSISGRALYFETYLPEYGAFFDKLPISAFVSTPETPNPDYPLSELQFWNCMDYGVTAICKQFIASMQYEARMRCGDVVRAEYLFTLDNYHADNDVVDCGTSEIPSEHKAMNVLALENGQFCAYPNNRMRVYDISLTPKEVLTPDFKASGEAYAVESHDLARYGDVDDYHY